MPRHVSVAITTALGIAWLLLGGLPGAAQPQRSRPIPIGPLTGPVLGAPRDLAWAYFRSQRTALGLADSDLADTVLRDEYVTAHNGVTHLTFRQRLAGIEVVNGDVQINVDRDGRVLNLHNRFIPGLARVANTHSPVLSPEEALAAAAQYLDLGANLFPTLLSETGGAARESVFAAPGLGRDEIPIRLMYYEAGTGDVRLTWHLVIRPPDRDAWWNIWVDAVTVEVLWKTNWVDHATYRVFAAPKESPDDGARMNEVDAADPTASPLGWHGADGVDTQLIGSNVFAQNWEETYSPDGGLSLAFQFPLDLANQEPAEYLDASLTNLFYWTNLLHDVLYHYGFDEVAGNFQHDNYGNPGLEDDEVLAVVHDPSRINNARFATPPDGIRGEMTHHIWTDDDAFVTVDVPPSIAGDYQAGGAAFGPPLDPVGITADLQLAIDFVAPITDGCEGFFPGFFTGLIAVIDRGKCLFIEKVKNAQNAGAIGAIIVNNQGDGVLTMSGSDPTITIPSVFIGQSDGTMIMAELPGVSATLRAVENLPDRDSGLDAGVIAHEYGHGLSNRLTGGPANSNCLDNEEQMGEGWSDFLALFMTALPSDSAEMPRGLGNYVTFQNPNDLGIRNFPYTTDMAVNPQTYADIANTNIPHGVGEIWASMLWEMYWMLVDQYGFDPDLKNGSGGNNLALQLVIDGLKLQPCSPSFVNARDAIFLADVSNNGGAHSCLLGKAFAKRGLGDGAFAGSSDDVTDGVESFDTGISCECGDGIDNDGDGRIDFDSVTFNDPSFQAGSGDPGCSDPSDATESPECQDGINNDADGLIDFDGGQSIHGACSGTCPPDVSDPDEDGVADPDPECITPYAVTEVPEPAGTILLVSGIAFLAVIGRKRMRG